jgi:hypothetical protein
MLFIELKLKDRKREAQEKRVKDLEEMRNKQQQEQEQRKLGTLYVYYIKLIVNEVHVLHDRCRKLNMIKHYVMIFVS